MFCDMAGTWVAAEVNRKTFQQYVWIEFIFNDNGVFQGFAQLERRDAGISHFEFHHYAPHHPRVSDHQLMARELISWLQANSPGTQRER